MQFAHFVGGHGMDYSLKAMAWIENAPRPRNSYIRLTFACYNPGR
jgi:hypothetical protein